MKEPVNEPFVAGMRISGADMLAPCGISGGTTVRFATKDEVPFGAAGSCCDVKVFEYSCKAYR